MICACSKLAKQDKIFSSGFILLEVLVALAILAIALVVLLGLRNRDVDLVKTTRNLTIATALARMKIVETEIEGFPELGEMAGEFGEDYPGFRWRRTISPTPFDYVREVYVAVSWGQRDHESMDLVNYIFENR